MTLNSRNKLFLFCFIIMAIETAVLVIAGLFTFFTGQLELLPESFATPSTFSAALLARTHHAGIISILILTIYATITGFVLYHHFEKTIASEIIYFAGFLMGVFLESFRLCIPLFGLWGGLSSALVFIGKASLSGRILTLFCLLFMSFPVSESFVQDTDKHMGISACIAVLFACVVPFSTHTILASVAVPFAYQNLFFSFQLMLFAVSMVTIICTNRFPRFLGVLTAYAGYMMLEVSANYALTIAGTILLVAGTILFLKKLHAFYLWK